MLFVSTVLFANTSFSQNELYSKLFSSFKEMPKSMSSAQLKEEGSHGVALAQQQSVILEELLITDNVVVPIGKVVKGKSITLLYMIVERKEIGSEALYIHIKSKTFNKKTGEETGSAAHLLDIGLGGTTVYDGSFKMIGDDFIEFSQDAVDPEDGSKISVKQYKFGKEALEFEKHVK